MTTTLKDITVFWTQQDQRSEGRDNPEFYKTQSLSDAVCQVANNYRTITICADGEMRINVENETGSHTGVIRYSDDLIKWGITNDTLLENNVYAWNAEPLLSPYGETVSFTVDNNPWFDLYDSEGNHLDAVAFSLSEAIHNATQLLLLPEWQGYHD